MASMIHLIGTNPLSRWPRTNPNFIINNKNTHVKKYKLKNNLPTMSSSYSSKEQSIRELEKEISSPLLPATTPTFDLKSYMHEKITSIMKALNEAVPLKAPVEIFEPMRYSLFAGGKRIKSIITIATCEVVGGQEQTAMPSACALEMIHTMTLMQDDLIDGHDLRRGKRACHKVFGDASAITGGDALISHAFYHMVARAKGFVSSERLVWIVEELARASGPQGVMGGQLLDTVLGQMSESELDALEHLHRLKTGCLIEASVVIGAILGGADREEVERLREFGKLVGKLFGVGDDFLDVEDDALVDKPTYPKAIGLERTRELLERLRSEAQEMLSGFGYDKDKVAPLSALVDFIAHRDH